MQMEYWGVDLPGLDRDAAEEVLAWAREQKLGEGGSVVDPSAFLTLHLDRDTVVALHTALSSTELIGVEPAETHEAAVIIRGIVEMLREWLDARP